MSIAPLNHHEQIRLESVSADYGNASLWFGEPTYESDRAWNQLIYRETLHFLFSLSYYLTVRPVHGKSIRSGSIPMRPT